MIVEHLEQRVLELESEIERLKENNKINIKMARQWMINNTMMGTMDIDEMLKIFKPKE